MLVRVLVCAVVLLAAGAAGGCAQAAQAPEAPPPPKAPWAWEMPHCPTYQPESYQARLHRVAVTAATGGAVAKVTEVYEPGWGAAAVADVRDVVQACQSYEAQDPEFREQHLVVGSGFAGDESLLVETVRLSPPDPPQTWYAAVVRDGEAVMTCRVREERELVETRCAATGTTGD